VVFTTYLSYVSAKKKKALVRRGDVERRGFMESFRQDYLSGVLLTL